MTEDAHLPPVADATFDSHAAQSALGLVDIALPPARALYSVNIPLPNGTKPTLHVFEELIGSGDHFVLDFGRRDDGPVNVRIHSSCITGDLFGSMRCDCGPQLQEAIDRFSVEGGLIAYTFEEGRGIGLPGKMGAYLQQDLGLDTFAANRAMGFANDLRDFRIPAQMLIALGVREIALWTNNPTKVSQLERWGIEVASVRPTALSINPHNARYLAAKRDLAGHMLPVAGGL